MTLKPSVRLSQNCPKWNELPTAQSRQSEKAASLIFSWKQSGTLRPITVVYHRRTVAVKLTSPKFASLLV